MSYYAIYPNGLLGDQRVPVPRSILLSALNARLAAVVASTGVNATIEGKFVVNSTFKLVVTILIQ